MTWGRVRTAGLIFASLVALAWTVTGPAQAQQQPAATSSSQQEPAQNSATPCIEPPPFVRWQDYQGPFKKVVGAFGQRLERRTVHPPHPPNYKPGTVLCVLKPKDKFILFVEDTFDPVSFLTAGFNAGIGQAQNTDRSFGQGAAGYGHRFGASFVDQASSEFFKDFAYPTIFSQDPRYYRVLHGSFRSRFAHALEHAFVAHREDGAPVFNFSEWLGTTSAVVLSNTYHPDNKRGFDPAAERVGINVAEDMGFDVLREFWPEIARKLKLPFRDQYEPAPPAAPAPNQGGWPTLRAICCPHSH